MASATTVPVTTQRMIGIQRIPLKLRRHLSTNASIWLVSIATAAACLSVGTYLIGRKIGWWGSLLPGEGPVVAGVFVICAAALTYYSSERSRRIDLAEFTHEQLKEQRTVIANKDSALRERFTKVEIGRASCRERVF